MKVSLCAPYYFAVDERGSDFVFQLGRVLGRKGVNVVLFTFTKGLESHLSVLSKTVLSLEGVTIKKFKPKVLRLVGMQPQFYCRALVKEISQEPADLIHMQGLNQMGVVYSVLRTVKCPVVASLRRSDSQRQAMLVGLGRIAWRKGFQRLGAGIEEFIVDDPHDRKTLELMGVREEKISAVPPSIDYPKMAALKRSEEDIALCVGRYSPEKGQHILLQAASQVLAHFPEVKFYLVGAIGDARYYSTLEEQARALGESVRLTGPLEEMRLLNLFSRAKVFVFPSVRDRKGLVIFEAMAAGIAVVASRVECTEPFLEDGVNGAMVPPEDPSALAARILDVWGNRELRERLAQAGRETARRWYWEIYSQRVLEIYERVLARKVTHRKDH